MTETSAESALSRAQFDRVRGSDPVVADLLAAEEGRQARTLDLIPSENYASAAVREALTSVLSAKYAEGYAGKRYYQGNAVVDDIESIAIDRAKSLFGVERVNVQALSGVPANHAVYLALAKPGDPTLGLEVPSGGHLSHGAKFTFVGRYYEPTLYQVDRDSETIDYDALADLVAQTRPRIIWIGTSSYSRLFDWERLGEIAKSVEAYFVADIAHVAGLVAGGVHPSPVPYADVVTTTTHKTLRGPRGALIMTNDHELADKIDRAVFPGLQGGPHQHSVAGIAVALAEAQTEGFRDYARQVVANAAALAGGLQEQGLELVSGGTDNHLMTIKLTPFSPPITGREAADALERAGLVANRNPIPYDPNPPFNPSGIRYGTPAVTTRGLLEPEMERIAQWTREVLDAPADEQVAARVREGVEELAEAYPIPN